MDNPQFKKETCSALLQKQIWEISASDWFLLQEYFMLKEYYTVDWVVTALR